MSFPDILTRLYEWKERQYHQGPVHTNRASQLGGDCLRELVYWRTSWEQATPPSRDLKVIFQEGSKHEEAILSELRAAGIPVIEQQLSLDWREYQISGHVDAVLPHEGESLPLEVKSMNPHIWDGCFRRGVGIYPWEEVREAFQAKSWLRRYLAQITLYMLLKNAERGLLICINKSTGAIAQVNVPLDYQYGESLIRRAQEINKHMRAGTLPDRIPWDEEVCPKCSFFGLCLPDRVGHDPLEFLEDAEVEGLLEARETYGAAAGEYKAADDRAKAWAKARPEVRIQIGRWLIAKKPHGKGVRVDVQLVGQAVTADPD